MDSQLSIPAKGDKDKRFISQLEHGWHLFSFTGCMHHKRRWVLNFASCRTYTAQPVQVERPPSIFLLLNINKLSPQCSCPLWSCLFYYFLFQHDSFPSSNCWDQSQSNPFLHELSSLALLLYPFGGIRTNLSVWTFYISRFLCSSFVVTRIEFCFYNK